MDLVTCKVCGADIIPENIENGVYKCGYCGATYTMPRFGQSEEVKMLLVTADAQLNNGEFDKAYETFERASQKVPKESEAYFGMALAEFKVNYIMDYVNDEEGGREKGKGRLQPICYAVNDKKFAENSNYLKALSWATDEQKEVYEKRAEEIDYIKEEFDILRKKGTNYDCFICVKVTEDETKRHTEDSAVANDIYYLLKNKGYNPFYSERIISKETGADYEAMILYALSTVDSMLVVCEDEKYLRTPWVKNEYLRFNELIKDGEKGRRSIAIVFGDRPIERLPGVRGKLQGICRNKVGAIGSIMSFIDSNDSEKQKKAAEEKEAEIKKLAEEQVKEKEETLKKQQDSERQIKALEEDVEKIKADIQQRQINNIAGKETAQTENKPEEYVNSNDNLRMETSGVYGDNENVVFKIEDGIIEKYYGDAEEISLPTGVVCIGKDAFAGCINLKQIILPEGLKIIEEGAFRGCVNLKSVIIPAGVKSIGALAFDSCRMLKEIKINEGVEEIGDQAFGSCAMLKKVSLPLSLKKIGGDIFYGYYTCEVHLKDINQIFEIENGSELKNSYGIYVNGKEIDKITIPDNISEIKEDQFYGAGYNIVIGKGVKKIGKGSFTSCPFIEEVSIPDAVNEIESYTFSHCVGLKDLKIGNNVKVIKDYAFMDCYSLKEVILPAKLRLLGIGCFKYCMNLEKVYIPKDVTTVKPSAFENCKKVVFYYEGTSIPDSWEKTWNPHNRPVVLGADLGVFKKMKV